MDNQLEYLGNRTLTVRILQSFGGLFLSLADPHGGPRQVGKAYETRLQ